MFTRLIEELVGKGLTEKDIGLRVGASQPTINRIKRANKTHQYRVGVAIVELHKSVMEGSLPDTTQTPAGTEQDPGMTFGEFGEPRNGDRREGERRQQDGGTDCDLGEPRDGDRRQEDRRGEDGETEKAA